MVLSTEKQFYAGFNLFWEQALQGDVISFSPFPYIWSRTHTGKAELQITVGKDKLEDKTKVISLSVSWQMNKSIVKLYNP